MLDEKNTQYLSTLPEEMDNVAMLDQQENMGASNLLQTGLISDIDRAGQAVEGAMKTTEEAQSDNQGLNSNIEVCYIIRGPTIFINYGIYLYIHSNIRINFIM